MNTYLFVMEFDGGTYLSQVKAPDIEGARDRWLEKVQLVEVAEASEEVAGELMDSLAQDQPTPVEGMQGVWCLFATAGEQSALVHAVQQSGLP